MNTTSAETGSRHYLWVHVVIAALAMVATMPGRTHGLGLITEPLLRALQIDRVHYAAINLWATLLGALFCLPCGWLLDRFGPRMVLAAISALLAAVVLFMSRIQSDWWTGTLQFPWMSAAMPFAFGLFTLVLLTRGLGQSALSVASLALIGKSTGRRSSWAYAVYSFVVAVGFMGAFMACRKVPETEWRNLWAAMGLALFGFAAMAPWLIRSSLLAGGNEAAAETNTAEAGSMTLGQALRAPIFWIFAIATSLYGAIAAGVSLFNQSILEERGFDRGLYLEISAIMPLIGLAANLGTGWLACRWSMSRLLACSMAVLGAALLFFPHVQTRSGVYFYAAAMGVAGGMVTVLFFGVWRKAFGTAELGRIQGVAQMLTVFASAVGPLSLAWTKEEFGSYTPLFRALAPVCAALGAIAWLTSAEERLLPQTAAAEVLE